jgi:hypothetical protein
VIFLSVVDHLASSRQLKGAFISKDGVFSKNKESFIVFAQNAGAQLDIHTTLEEVRVMLLREALDPEVAIYITNNSKAEELVHSHVAEIEAFIANSFLEADPLFKRRLRRCELVGIRNVETEIPTSEAQLKSVTFRADIKLHFAEEEVSVALDPITALIHAELDFQTNSLNLGAAIWLDEPEPTV